MQTLLHKNFIPRLFLVVAIGALLIFAGCSKSPDAEMQAASTAIEHARAAEAEQYAPDAWQAIQDTLQTALVMKQEQDNKFALMRSYDDVKALFTRIEAQANAAATVAETGKQQMRSDVETLLASAQEAATTNSQSLAKARNRGVKKEDADLIATDLAGVNTLLTEANNDFTAGNYFSAKEKTLQVIDRSNTLAHGIEFAITDVKEAQPKSTPKTTAPAPSASDKNEIEWVSYDVGVPRAKTENKHVVIDFTTSWCGWCKKMEAETFTDPGVIKLVNDNFVPVRVIGDSEHKLDINGYKISEEDLTTKTFGVRGFPCFAFLTPDGQNLGTIPGYRPKDNFVELLTYVKDKKYIEEMKQRQQEEQQKQGQQQPQTSGNN